MTLRYSTSKRLMDFSTAFAALIVLSPVLALVALAVRLKLGGPALFRQPRPGLEGKLFTCLKFRTMSDDRDAKGALLADEQRLGRFGKALRSTSLDELPQLLNILAGDMSLVGPRPLMVRYLPRYSVEQQRRHSVRPGITGWAQVNGRNMIDWDRKLALDTWYADNCSFVLDLRILVKTVWIVLTGAGVSRPGQVSMDEFLGSGSSD